MTARMNEGWVPGRKGPAGENKDTGTIPVRSSHHEGQLYIQRLDY